ncbi:hypothetical protein [Dokdonella sp.]|uniref:hypothetical protein n=1 Tax=Dokdonella sp. TaxID=2291710 RepID=UPI0031CAC6CF|nr:hypothetical protein [Dokdonella sp.]
MMHGFALLLALAGALAAGLPARVAAATATEALGTCLADETSGRDRKMLARWVFVAMSTHPTLKDVASVSAAARDAADREMATLVTRLLSEDCPAQTARAMREDGASALEGAFGSLGELAMVELMSHPAVAASIATYTKYLDDEKLKAVMQEPAQP